METYCKLEIKYPDSVRDGKTGRWTKLNQNRKPKKAHSLVVMILFIDLSFFYLELTYI